MAIVLESHLSLLEREAEAPAGSSAADRRLGTEDLIALHVAVFEVMERRLGTEGLTEAHRPLAALYRRWLCTARKLIDVVRDLRAEGQEVEGVDSLLRAMNRAKPAAENFDHFVSLNQRLARGEAGAYRSLGEVVDELRTKDQPLG